MRKAACLLAVLTVLAGSRLYEGYALTVQDPNKVRARVQARPGGPVVEVEMAIHPVPVDPPSVSAADAALADDDLVLGVVLDGKPVAYPIRYLALHEILNDRVGNTPIAPTW